MSTISDEFACFMMVQKAVNLFFSPLSAAGKPIQKPERMNMGLPVRPVFPREIQGTSTRAVAAPTQLRVLPACPICLTVIQCDSGRLTASDSQCSSQ